MTTKGYFGQFGGSFVPEPIQALLDELEVTFDKYKDDPEFLAEFRHYLKDYSGRETPLYFAESLTDHLGGAKIYLKREDLNHLGSHKLNNVFRANSSCQTYGQKTSDCRNRSWSARCCDSSCCSQVWYGL